MQDTLHDLDDYGEPPSPRISFSFDEVLHLAMSVIVLSLAFSFALGAAGIGAKYGVSLFAQSPCELGECFERAWSVFPASLVIVLTAFVLHEVAHKIAAQRMHMWAEFRSSVGGLLVGLAVSMGLGVVFAAPGAVYIFGRATKRDSGVISVVGPLVNVVLASIAIVLFEVARDLDFRVGAVGSFFHLTAFINLVLALFNMLPIPPLDGSKVWRWSKLAYVGTILLVVALFVVNFAGFSALVG